MLNIDRVEMAEKKIGELCSILLQQASARAADAEIDACVCEAGAPLAAAAGDIVIAFSRICSE